MFDKCVKFDFLEVNCNAEATEEFVKDILDRFTAKGSVGPLNLRRSLRAHELAKMTRKINF